MMVPLADPVSKEEILSRSAAIRLLHTEGRAVQKIQVTHFFAQKICLFK